MLKAGTWYVAARTVEQDAVRTYRLAKLLDLQPGSKGFRRPRNFDLAAYWQASSARFEAQLRPLQAHVRASRRGLNWLDNARLDYVARPQDSTRDAGPHGWQAVLLPIESIEHGARQVLGFGAEIEVLLLPGLRALVLRLANSLAALHSKAGEEIGTGPGV